ncbi:MAG: lipopolysaccharide biosynthesis protein [Gemmatimonadota bacterium]
MTERQIDARHEMKRGLWWSGASTVAMRILDVGGSLLVLQFLSRAEVGLAALAWSVSVLLESFNGLGVSYVIVRQRDLTHQDLSGLFWFSTLLGVAMVAIMAAVGPYLAVFYADWRLYPMMLVAATKLIFVGAALVPLNILTRDLHFKTSGAVQTLATLGEALTKVVLVAAGFGAWGLVISNLARGVFLCLALWRLAPFRPAWQAADVAVRKAIRFGLRVSASGTLYQAYRNMDNLLIGRVLGASVLGIYQTAFQLGMTPLEIVLQLVNRVQFPIYSALREKPAELAQAFNRSARTLFLFLGPVAVFLCFASRDILSLIGGGKWLPAVPMIQVLVWASLLRGMSQLFPQLYIATGHPKYAVVDSAVTGGTLVAGFAIALALAPPGQGALWVAWVWLLSYPVPLIAHYVMVRRSAPIQAGDFLRTLLKPAIGIAALALLLGLGSLLRASLGSPVLMLALLATLALGGHALYLRYVMHLRMGDILPRKQQAQ